MLLSMHFIHYAAGKLLNDDTRTYFSKLIGCSSFLVPRSMVNKYSWIMQIHTHYELIIPTDVTDYSEA